MGGGQHFDEYYEPYLSLETQTNNNGYNRKERDHRIIAIFDVPTADAPIQLLNNSTGKESLEIDDGSKWFVKSGDTIPTTYQFKTAGEHTIYVDVPVVENLFGGNANIVECYFPYNRYTRFYGSQVCSGPSTGSKLKNIVIPEGVTRSGQGMASFYRGTRLVYPSTYRIATLYAHTVSCPDIYYFYKGSLGQPRNENGALYAWNTAYPSLVKNATLHVPEGYTGGYTTLKNSNSKFVAIVEDANDEI